MEFNRDKVLTELARLKWTRKKLASKMGVTRQYVEFYLRPKKKDTKNMTLKTIDRFALALNMDGKDLIKS